MGHRILLVDDNRDFCSDFKLWFPEYDILAAHAAEDALAVLSRPNTVKLVLLDVQLPGMGGLAALEKLRALAPSASVVIMTGFSSKDVAIRALRGKADGYLEKPFSIKEVRETIERELSKDLPPPDGDMNGRMERVKRFIETNCFKKITLKDAAAEVYVSPKHLSRVFRQHTGMGFTEYKLKVKVDQARALLASGSQNIKQVSARLGYANTESFIRQFTKIAGCLPSAFKKAGSCRKPGRRARG